MKDNVRRIYIFLLGWSGSHESANKVMKSRILYCLRWQVIWSSKSAEYFITKYAVGEIK